MEDKKPIESFFTDLSNGLLFAENTNEIDRVVDLFLEKICQYYNFDCGEVYFPKGEYLILRGVYGIDRYYVCKVDFPITNDNIKEILYDGKKYIGKNISNSNAEVFLNYNTLLALPISISKKNIGIIVFRNREDKIDFYNSILDEIQNFIGHFAVYANNVLQHVTYKEKDKQLKLLRELYFKLSDIDKFEINLKELASDVANIFSASKSFIRIRYKKDNFDTISSYGFEDNFDYSVFEKKEYEIKYIENKVNYINNIEKNEDSNNFRNIINRSVLFNRIPMGGGCMGYAVVIDKIKDAVNPLGDFDKDDCNLFNPLLANISSRISEYYSIKELDKANEKNKKNMSRLSTLYDISNILLERSKPEDILFMLLTIATIGDVFAFNRAFAFLYDKEFNVFRGRMCVAPKDGENAGDIWNHMNSVDKSIRETLLHKQYYGKDILSNMKNIDKYALREKLMLSLDRNNLEASWDLNQKFLNTVIPNSEQCQLFFDLFNNKESINIKSVNDNNQVEQLRNYTDIFGYNPFAIVPIMDANNCVGVILVDNIYNNIPIPDDDLDYLKMFGRQAAIALEYSSLYNEIEKSRNDLKVAEKSLLDIKSLAIIGEMSSSMAHNLRNFIVPISGFANRLVKISSDERVSEYAKIIADEVDKLETYIRRNLTFAKSINLIPESIKVDDIVKYITVLAKEYIKKSEKKIKFYAVKTTKEEFVRWDYSRMNDVIINLIINAIDAIENENDAIISVTFADNSYKESMIDIIVENTNSYIEPETINKLFTPFFTTKSHGVGIGLAVSKRIVEAHGGSMIAKSVKNNFEATAFFITMPVELSN
ncbi:GAF domain-containing sensor histidine kinase [Brachyspira aalborgi]|uniref:histidine kinase n=1 Tax=Brachyspira aalborgi TaxID=29522 RepID=A0A5C8FHN6_9SPIR|nr:GAF domain-containing sensor histidine kinase [Brachyspira aalborgi]TXJ48150.1 GAF domain-containing sensor histidine kinase [Brachyspira aalborgi]